MYRIFNYNKTENKVKKYRIYKFISIMLSFAFLCLIIFGFFNIELLYKPVGVIPFIVWAILYALFIYSISKLYKKHFNCCAYILNENSKEFYKIGIFPNIVKFKPTEEGFLTDNYFANYMFSNIKKCLRLCFIRDLNYSVKEFAKDNVSLKAGDVRTTLYLNTLIKLNNHDYILKQLNNKRFNGIVFKITKIHSYEFEDNDNYYIVCDVIENNKQTEYKKVKLTINKEFEEDDKIKNYIINNCEQEID